MNAALQTELEEILARFAAAEGEKALAFLKAQFDERVAHLIARGAKAPEPAIAAASPPSVEKKPSASS